MKGIIKRMQFEVGSIVDGTITGIAKFGAFVSLGEGKTGMIHISEIASTYVKEVADFVEIGQGVKVKIINISEDDKIGLSIKQVPDEMNPQVLENQEMAERRQERVVERARAPRPPRQIPPPRTGPPPEPPILGVQPDLSGDGEFEDMLKKFKQRSEDKISDLKRSTEAKRNGGRRGGGR